MSNYEQSTERLEKKERVRKEPFGNISGISCLLRTLDEEGRVNSKARMWEGSLAPSLLAVETSSLTLPDLSTIQCFPQKRMQLVEPRSTRDFLTATIVIYWALKVHLSGAAKTGRGTALSCCLQQWGLLLLFQWAWLRQTRSLGLPQKRVLK